MLVNLKTNTEMLKEPFLNYYKKLKTLDKSLSREIKKLSNLDNN
jgi:hypothetical protein